MKAHFDRFKAQEEEQLLAETVSKIKAKY